MNNEEKIIICENCQGTGYVTGAGAMAQECPVCYGHGRMLRRITVVDTPLDEENLKRKAIYG